MNRRRFLAGSLLGCLLLSRTLPAAQPGYRFAVVPQQPPSTILRLWEPLVAAVAARSGVPLELATYPRIPAFEQALEQGEPDFAYMNPLHYVRVHDSQGYRALVHARDRRLRGILVVRRDGPIRTADDLRAAELAFPAPGAFAASVLIRGWLDGAGIDYTPVYVRSHDSVYLNVARGHYPAGGGVPRTLANQPDEVRARLRVIHETPGYTPHAIAAHPRVPPEVAERVRAALVGLGQDAQGRAILDRLRVNGWVAADDSEWNDVRQLKTEVTP